MDAELTQFHECSLAPTDGVGGERQREGHPVLLPERLTVAQDVVMAGRGLDREAGRFEPADEPRTAFLICSRLRQRDLNSHSSAGRASVSPAGRT